MRQQWTTPYRNQATVKLTEVPVKGREPLFGASHKRPLWRDDEKNWNGDWIASAAIPPPESKGSTKQFKQHLEDSWVEFLRYSMHMKGEMPESFRLSNDDPNCPYIVVRSETQRAPDGDKYLFRIKSPWDYDEIMEDEDLPKIAVVDRSQSNNGVNLYLSPVKNRKPSQRFDYGSDRRYKSFDGKTDTKGFLYRTRSICIDTQT